MIIINALPKKFKIISPLKTDDDLEFAMKSKGN